MTGARPLWLATLGWGPDPWWDVTGRTARRRARRRLLDLALIVAVLAAFVSTSGTGARIAGATVEPQPRAPATAPVEASSASEVAMPIVVAQPLAETADAGGDRPPIPNPTGAPNVAPWAALLVAMVVAFAATLRTRSRRPR